MPTKRPAIVVIIALMQLGFGGMALFNSVISLTGLQNWLASFAKVGGSIGESLSPQEIESRLTAAIPYYGLIQLGSDLLGVVLALLMLGSAVGLLRLRPWGRQLTLIYVLGSIAYNIAYYIFAFGMQLPATFTVLDSMPKPAGQEGEMWPTILLAAKISTFVGLGLGSLSILYPLAILIVMFRPAVRAVFRGEEYKPLEPEDYRDPSPPLLEKEPIDHSQSGAE
jgi:hypothetical protein